MWHQHPCKEKECHISFTLFAVHYPFHCRSVSHWFFAFHSSSSPSMSIPSFLSIFLSSFSSFIILLHLLDNSREHNKAHGLYRLLWCLNGRLLYHMMNMSFNHPTTIYAIVSTLTVNPITDKSVTNWTISVNFTIMCGHSSSSPFIPNTYSIAAVMLNMIISSIYTYQARYERYYHMVWLCGL